MFKHLITYFLKLILILLCFRYIKDFKFNIETILIICLSIIIIIIETKKKLKDNKLYLLLSKNKDLFLKSLYIIFLTLTIMQMPIICCYGKIRFMRLIFIGFLIFNLGLVSQSLIKNFTKEYLKNILLSITTLIIFVLIIESIFMFVSYPFGSGDAYAGQLFNYKYWKPINSDGFRDENFSKNENAIIFLGDSFTAGWGIKDTKNRFSEITEKELNDKELKFYNIGQYGADSKIEFENLKKIHKKYTPKCKKLVLQVLYNDIDPYLKNEMECNHNLQTLENTKTLGFKNGFYLINFLDNFFPNSSQKSIIKGCDYESKLKEGYSDSSIYNKMFIYHDSIINFCKKQNIKPIVVYFPFMEDLNYDSKLNIGKRFKDYFKSKNVDFIDIKKNISQLTINQRKASKMDAHASEKVHEIVGRIVANKLK